VSAPIGKLSPDLAAWAARPDAVPAEQAAQAFEALLIRQIVEKAQEPVFESKLFGSDAGSSLYRSWFAEAVAGQMAARGGFGLAAAMQRELAPEAAAKEKP